MADTLERLRAALADRYTLDRELGHGGNATVYLAHDRKHDRQVALKVLLPELALSVRTERFLREIQIAAQLRATAAAGALDPNVVAVLPFRVSGTDPELRALREGMVNLLATKLTGEHGGPRACDPRTTLQTGPSSLRNRLYSFHL